MKSSKVKVWEVSQKVQQATVAPCFFSAIRPGKQPAADDVVPPRDLIERTRLFALAVLDFCQKAPNTDEAREAAEQLRKSANSVRSNCRAARKGRSRREFQSKLHVAFEEAGDAALLREAKEIALLATAVRTAKQNTARTKEVPKS